MRVKELMTSDPACCTPESKLDEVARVMVAQDCGAVPIVDERSRRLVGIVTDRDIAARTLAQGRNPLDMAARDVMSTQVAAAHPDDDLNVATRIMEERQVRRVPVVDDDGYCCGIVAQADLARRTDERTIAEVVHDVSMPSGAARATGR